MAAERKEQTPLEKLYNEVISTLPAGTTFREVLEWWYQQIKQRSEDSDVASIIPDEIARVRNLVRSMDSNLTREFKKEAIQRYLNLGSQSQEPSWKDLDQLIALAAENYISENRQSAQDVAKRAGFEVQHQPIINVILFPINQLILETKSTPLEIENVEEVDSEELPHIPLKAEAAGLKALRDIQYDRLFPSESEKNQIAYLTPERIATIKQILQQNQQNARLVACDTRQRSTVSDAINITLYSINQAIKIVEAMPNDSNDRAYLKDLKELRDLQCHNLSSASPLEVSVLLILRQNQLLLDKLAKPLLGPTKKLIIEQAIIEQSRNNEISEVLGRFCRIISDLNKGLLRTCLDWLGGLMYRSENAHLNATYNEYANKVAMIQEITHIVGLISALSSEVKDKDKEKIIRQYEQGSDTPQPSWCNVRRIVAESARLSFNNPCGITAGDDVGYDIEAIVLAPIFQVIAEFEKNQQEQGTTEKLRVLENTWRYQCESQTDPLNKIAQLNKAARDSKALKEVLSTGDNRVKVLKVYETIANHKDNVNEIVALFERAIDRLGESSFKTGLLHLHEEMFKECPKEENKQLKAKVAQEMVGQVRQALTLMTAMVDDEVNADSKSDAIDTFHKASKQSTSLGKTILKAAAVVAITALCMVGGAAIGFGFGAAVGAWAGPLSFFTAMVGLVGGAAKGVAGGIAVAGVVGLGVSAKGFFGKSGRQKAVTEVEEGAREGLSKTSKPV